MTQPSVVELVTNAMGCGVMMALEGRHELVRKLSTLPANGSLADALKSDAEKFLQTRSDLVDALTVEILETLTGHEG